MATMNFYFCEGCKKRLTEKDIDEGSARDKKLRGVYCKECAQGVFTMDTMPVSKEEAEEILRKEKEAKSGVHPRASSTQTRAAAASKRTALIRAPGSTRAHRSGQMRVTSERLDGKGVSARSQPPPAKSSTPMIIGAAAAIVIGLGVIAMMLGGSSTPQQKKARKKTVKKVAKAETTSNALQPTAAPEPGQAARGKDRTEDVVTTQRKTPPPAPEPNTNNATKTSKPGATPVSKGPSEEELKQQEAARAALAAKEAARTAKEAADAKLFEYFDQLATALHKNDRPAAEKICIQAQGDGTVAPFASSLKSLADISVVFDRVRDAQLEGLKRLVNGKEHELQTKPKPMKGVITKVDGAEMQVLVKAGPGVEFKKTIELSDIDPAQHPKLLAKFTPTLPKDWVVEAFKRMKEMKLAEAAKALDSASGHGLETLQRKYLARLKIIEEMGEDEFYALETWKKAERLFKGNLYTDALKIYTEFESKYAKTKAYEKYKDTLAQRKKAMADKMRIVLTDLKPESMENMVTKFWRIAEGKDWITGNRHCKYVYQSARTDPNNPAITWRLPGPYKLFRAGVINFHSHSSPTWFSVWGDGKQLWISKPKAGRWGPDPCEVDITGVKMLTLKTHCRRQKDAHTTWIEPQIFLIKPNAAK